MLIMESEKSNRKSRRHSLVNQIYYNPAVCFNKTNPILQLILSVFPQSLLHRLLHGIQGYFHIPYYLHRCPESSFLSSSLVYSLPLSRISTALMMTPGVQNPHCTAASIDKSLLNIRELAVRPHQPFQSADFFSIRPHLQDRCRS